MFVIDDATVVAVRSAFNEKGWMAAAIQLRQSFQCIAISPGQARWVA